MLYVNKSNELYHYGVKGMKWGHRKNVYDVNASYYNKRAKKLDAAARRNKQMAGMQRAAANSGNANGLLSKGNQINANYYQKRADKLTAKADKSRTMAKLNAQASKNKVQAAAAKKERKAAIKSTYKQLNREASFAEKLNGNNATRKLAAKYIVDKGMTVSEAKTKAYGVAKRNSMIILAAYGAMAVGSNLANRR